MDLNIELTDNEVLNVRTCALIKCEGKYLLSKKENENYYSLPGGRIKVGEDSSEAIIRELKEELNYDITKGDLKLVRIVENFFNLKDKRFHEYLFIYVLDLNPEYYHSDFINLENPHMKMIWVAKEALTLLDVKPGLIKGILNSDEFRHMIVKE